jgi:BASS family bile acid:Na+ symporter
VNELTVALSSTHPISFDLNVLKRDQRLRACLQANHPASRPPATSMNPAIRLFVAVTLFITMLGLGMGLPRNSLRRWVGQPSMPLRVALGSCLLVPLLGVVLLHSPWGSTISPPMRVATALMALCPSAPLAMRKVRKQGGDHALAAVVQVLAAFIAMISIPLMAPLFPHAFDRGGWLNGQVTLTLQTGGEVFLQVLRVQVIPLVLGLALRSRQPALADRLEKPLNRIAALLILLLVVLILISASPYLLQFITGNLAGLLLMAVQVIGCLLIGRALAGGHVVRHGSTTALVTAMRNAGLALLFAYQFGDEVRGLKLAILLYVLLTALISVPVLRLSQSRRLPA